MEKKFELKSIKIGLLGVECKYCVSEDVDGVSVEVENNVKDSRPVHDDLYGLFDGKIAGEILGVEPGKLTMTGVSLTGKDDNAGVRLSGEIHTAFGSAVFKTPRIKYLVGDAPVKAELTVFVQSLIEEVRKYLMEGKIGETEEW